MRIKLVRLGKGQFDLELFLAALGLAAVAGMAFLHWVPRERIPLPRCTFRVVTGQPCLTCGGTRAATALSRFDFRKAFASNPLVALGLALSGPLVLWGAAAWRWNLPRPRLEFKSRLERRIFIVTVLLVVAANWAYLIVEGI